MLQMTHTSEKAQKTSLKPIQWLRWAVSSPVWTITKAVPDGAYLKCHHDSWCEQRRCGRNFKSTGPKTRAVTKLLSLMSFTASKHQVAGHDGSLIAKGMFAKKTSSQEIQFYQQLHQLDAKSDDDSIGNLLIDWVPLFYGTLTENQVNEDIDEISHSLHSIKLSHNEIPSSVKSTDNSFIVLSNLYENYKTPSILDIKLGSLLTDENAAPDKVKRLKSVSDSTTSGSLNLRICGMKVYNKSNEVPDSLLSDFATINDNGSLEQTVTLVEHDSEYYLKFDKFFGRALKPDHVKAAIKLYIYNGVPNPKVGDHYVIQFYKRLQLLYNCLLNYEVRIISGSLLFITENDPEALSSIDLEDDPLILNRMEDELEEEENDDEDNDLIVKQLSSLNLIDFAHSKFVKGKGIDENTIAGVENLITIFEELMGEIE